MSGKDGGKDGGNGTGRKNGRPFKADGPRVPYDELDKILVHGETVTCEDGESTTVVYPSYRELAERYGVCNSVIARFASNHNCRRRRELANARIAAQIDQKIVERRSTALAFSREDELRIIDTYLANFEEALMDDRVRCDNPSDLNTMLRLKQFLLGGADSRQEIQAMFSLEALQERHREMLKVVEGTSAAERGEVGPRLFTPAETSSKSDQGVCGQMCQDPETSVNTDPCEGGDVALTDGVCGGSFEGERLESLLGEVGADFMLTGMEQKNPFSSPSISEDSIDPDESREEEAGILPSTRSSEAQDHETSDEWDEDDGEE